jgi:predicted GTPase
VVLSGTPIDLTRVLKVSKPMTRARYDLAEIKPGKLEAEVRRVLKL